MLVIYTVGIVFLLTVGIYYDLYIRISYGDLSVEQSKQLIESNPLLVIVDVRTASEFDTGNIEGAINLCLCDEIELLNNLEPNYEILVYCHSGARSKQAMIVLNENGYRKVYNMLKGITGWVDKGYPVVHE